MPLAKFPPDWFVVRENGRRTIRPRRPGVGGQQIGSIVVGAETASLIVPSPLAVVSTDPIVDPSATPGGNAGAVPTSIGSCFVSFVMRFSPEKINRAERRWGRRPVPFCRYRRKARLRRAEGVSRHRATRSCVVCDPKAALGSATPFGTLCQDCLGKNRGPRKSRPRPAYCSHPLKTGSRRGAHECERVGRSCALLRGGSGRSCPFARSPKINIFGFRKCGSGHALQLLPRPLDVAHHSGYGSGDCRPCLDTERSVKLAPLRDRNTGRLKRVQAKRKAPA
jgi:hypothetical protein